MGTWFIGAKEMADVYKAEEAMKSLPAECDDAGKDAWVGFLKREGRWDDSVCEAIANKTIMFDGGGSVRTDEPLIAWEANDCKMKTYVRQLPFLIEEFKNIRAVPALPGIVGLGGFVRKYFLSPQTVKGSIEKMEGLLRGTESLRQELEADLHKDFNKTKGAASARKCGCMSGKMYGDCCGKFIESAEQRKLRKAISGP